MGDLDRRSFPTHLLDAKYDGPLVRSQPETNGESCEYTMCTGSKYVGPMKDGMAEGIGVLHLSDGRVFRAIWKKGKAVDFPRDLAEFKDPNDPYDDSCYTDLMDDEKRRQDACGGRYLMKDGLEHRGDLWRYCNGETDRRFYAEATKGDLGKPGETMMGPGPGPVRDVPEGMYDCGEGFYDPERKLVTDYDSGEYIRYVGRDEDDWIVLNCRQGPELLKADCRRRNVENATNGL
ncbi:MORN repeat-containing protein 5-like [Sycon ciliatum]|uniref:MORN repeat-containing protein 5-like n=1 Tax=Sycon ciliatum TaxID=27933 RepID=UPI0020A93747|eukprot:scpid54964/ scgid13558/ MORN repeat-containing protein 5